MDAKLCFAALQNGIHQTHGSTKRVPKQSLGTRVAN